MDMLGNIFNQREGGYFQIEGKWIYPHIPA